MIPCQPVTAEDRFWSKVDADGDCWEWVAGRFASGYGAFRFEGKQDLAHRVAWRLLVGPIGGGLTIDHLCQNRSCVNPDHLDPVPMGVNTLRSSATIAGRKSRQTMCLRNHPLIGANLYVTRNGRRQCRECARGRDKARYRRRVKQL